MLNTDKINGSGGDGPEPYIISSYFRSEIIPITPEAFRSLIDA